MKETIKIFFLLFVVCFVVHLLNNKIGSIPPPGKFLDPFNGYISSSNNQEISKINILELKESVDIVWDENWFPHIFAKNDKDLYMVQGYIVASDRLWQMDFITRLHAGKLSEIIGYNKAVLRNDRFMRRIGIVEAAKASLSSIANCINQENIRYDNWDGLEECPEGYSLIKKESAIYDMLLAYSIGINQYINSLDYANLPIEYKILDYSPNLWNPLRTCILLKTMSLDLTGRNSDLVYNYIINNYGQDDANFLYPEITYNNDPIIPLEDFKSINNPIEPVCLDDMNQVSIQLSNISDMSNPGIGSNNWAVHKDKTKNGYALLANDPHLGLALPNVWYVMHLSSPEQNVMGATMPGAPGILSGFNDYIAWGETNGADDVSDFYEITIDPQNSNNYIFDNKSIPLDIREEKIFIRGDGLNFPQIYLDTIKSTHHGPILIDNPNDDMMEFNRGLSSIYSDINLAFKWAAHNPSNEIKTFYEINHAKNYGDFVNALSSYECPCQNFVYADIKGNIAIHHNGKIPVRCRNYSRNILPGDSSIYDWNSFIPYEHLPHVKNPERGYVSSANQYPVSKEYPYYLPGSFWPSYRGSRINDLLDFAVTDGATINDMQKIQNDSYNKFAEDILPNLLGALENNESFFEDLFLVEIHSYLKQWVSNPIHTADSFEAIIFDQWYENLNELIWSNLFLDENNEKLYSKHVYPLFDRLAKIIKEKEYWESKWFDDKKTAIKESFQDVAFITFKKTLSDLSNHEKLKDKDYKDWKYSDFRGTDIHHIISSESFDAFSRMAVPTSGSKWAPNAMKKEFGPSWRYIVEMKEYDIQAIGIYPGGQSGNPGSSKYDNFIDQWKDGEYLDLNFTYYRDKDSLKGKRVTFINED